MPCCAARHPKTFADDVTALASEEMCDVIVDDVAVFES